MKYEQKSWFEKEFRTWWLGKQCASEIRYVPLKRHFLSDVNLFNIDPGPMQADSSISNYWKLDRIEIPHWRKIATNTKLELRDDKNTKKETKLPQKCGEIKIPLKCTDTRLPLECTEMRLPLGGVTRRKTYFCSTCAACTRARSACGHPDRLRCVE